MSTMTMGTRQQRRKFFAGLAWFLRRMAGWAERRADQYMTVPSAVIIRMTPAIAQLESAPRPLAIENGNVSRNVGSTIVAQPAEPARPAKTKSRKTSRATGNGQARRKSGKAKATR